MTLRNGKRVDENIIDNSISIVYREDAINNMVEDS